MRATPPSSGTCPRSLVPARAAGDSGAARSIRRRDPARARPDCLAAPPARRRRTATFPRPPSRPQRNPVCSWGGTINRLGVMRPILIATLCALVCPTQAPAPLRVSAPAAAPLQPGSVLLLTIATGDQVPALRARAFNRELAPFRADAVTWQVLVGIDLDVKPGTYPVEIEAGPQTRTAYALAVKPHRFPTRTLKVDPDLVNPPPQEMERIARETRQLGRLWAAPPSPPPR